MNFLLDTCTFLWLLEGGSRISDGARAELVRADNALFLSAVSVWEIAVKHAAGRLPFSEPPERLVPAERARRGIALLPLDETAALHLLRLPAIHRDPFDRMLVCQALVEGLVVVTPDADIARYPVRTLW